MYKVDPVGTGYLLWNKRTKRCRLRIKGEVVVTHQYLQYQMNIFYGGIHVINKTDEQERRQGHSQLRVSTRI